MFRSVMRADDSSDRSPYVSFWFSPAPFNGSAGTMTGENAMRLTAVYRCVRLLSESLSMLPFMLYEPQADGGRKPMRDHWLYRLLAVRPNDYQNPLQFRQMMQSHLELRGNAYARIYANGRGEVTDLIPIHPDRVAVEMIDNNNWRYRVRNSDQSETVLNRGQVFHRKDLTLDGILGVNPIRAASEAIGTGMAAQSYGYRFFANNAVPPGWVELDREFKTDEQRRVYRDQLQKALGGRNQGKLAVLELGAKYHEVKVTNADAQFIESKKFTVTEVARMFGVPPHKVGDMSASTNNNIEQQSLDYVQDAVVPRAAAWEAAIVYEFIEDSGLQIELDLKPLLKADSAARANYKQKGILTGWLTRNEARIEDGLNPLPGLDEPLIPVNTAPVDESGTPKPIGGGADRLGALATATAERVARKEVAVIAKAKTPEALAACYDKHAYFVAEAFGVSIETARDYCSRQLLIAANLSADELEACAQARLARLATEPEHPATSAARVIAGAMREIKPAQIQISPPAVTVNVQAPPVPAVSLNPVINVEAPKIEAAQISIAAPVINVAPPAVTVDAPQVHVEAPVVNIAPATVNVTFEEPPVSDEERRLLERLMPGDGDA